MILFSFLMLIAYKHKLMTTYYLNISAIEGVLNKHQLRLGSNGKRINVPSSRINRCKFVYLFSLQI